MNRDKIPKLLMQQQTSISKRFSLQRMIKLMPE